MSTGLIFDIKKFAIHDGPGIRTTVFFKGCPLGCMPCHNPEGQSSSPEIWYREERCIECEDCLGVCDQDAISFDEGKPHIDRGRCDMGGACVQVCPVRALEIIGREMTVDEVMVEIMKDYIFYDQSGGGVSFSGGEPLAQPEFLLELLQACRESGLHTTLDTSGYAPAEVFREVAGLTDHFLYDLKIMDDERHRQFTGVSNVPVLENLMWLCGQDHSTVVRFPPVPGVNDDEDNIRLMGEFVSGLANVPGVDILPYHMIGVGKYARLDRDYKLSETNPPPGEDVARIVDILERYGLEVRVRGEVYAVE